MPVQDETIDTQWSLYIHRFRTLICFVFPNLCAFICSIATRIGECFSQFEYRWTVGHLQGNYLIFYSTTVAVKYLCVITSFFDYLHFSLYLKESMNQKKKNYVFLYFVQMWSASLKLTKNMPMVRSLGRRKSISLLIRNLENILAEVFFPDNKPKISN